MNRLIVTFVIGKLLYAEWCLPSMREYASRCGADFLEVKWLHEIDKEYHGNPNWSCVHFLKAFARQDHYGEVLMLDADVLVLDECPNLFDMPGDLICVPDSAWPEKDDRYRNWLSRNYPNSSELGVKGAYFNAGVLLFRREAVARMDLAGPYPDDYANDQDFLNMRAGEAGLDVKWLGYEFNQRHVSNVAHTIRHNHILHFVGCKHMAKTYHSIHR